LRRIPISKRSPITAFQPLPTGTTQSVLERDSVILTNSSSTQLIHMWWRIFVAVLLGIAAPGGAAFAAEHAAVLELGGAGEWQLNDSNSQFGPTVAVEVTPIERWLELEFGVTAFRTHRATEWETDLLFKKPYTLSPTVEFMAGLGPAWSHSNSPAERANSIGGEFVLDFMFWPKDRWGWYLEPSYGYGFNREHLRSVGISAGLLFGFP
jgi:hypothetical protein